jgi:ABC-type amino acid transport substrate-binding protein
MKWSSTWALAAGLLIAAGVARSGRRRLTSVSRISRRRNIRLCRQEDQGRDRSRDSALYHARPEQLDQLIGFGAELAETTFKRIGVPMDFSVGSWSGRLPAVANGRTGFTWDTRYDTPERATQMDFVIYFAGATGGLVAKGNPKHIIGLDLGGICGDRAAAALASAEEKEFHDISDRRAAAGRKPIGLFVAPTSPPAIVGSSTTVPICI